MGIDKARIAVGGDTLLERAVKTLSELTPRVMLACGATERYADLGLPLCLDRRPDAGPLAGLESALASAREEWILALACDLPRLRAEDLARLIDRARADDLDACYFETSRGLEPLCALYRRACLPAVRAALAAGERRMISFLDHEIAGGARPRIGTVPAEEFAERLVNVNSPEDLAALGGAERESA